MIRALILAMIAVAVLAVMPARADAQTLLPQITVRPPSPKNTDPKGSGVDIKGGDSSPFGRLNDQLKRKVDETNPIGNTPPLDARSPDTKTGVVNIPGVQQQYGKNFGHSVIPYRPPPPVYTPPLGPQR
ncbi:hypothetical protein [Rhodopseudomonas palustris]|uniref:hypothetical protein n=1 Tax=Rhodopseudomonas palustris TaxID=1076 RepID=UPI0039F4A105